MINVLFVCVENSCCSQMAEAFANMDGQDIIKPYSAGSHPADTINPNAVEAMREVGYDLSVHASKGLDAIPDIVYDLVVTMGCDDACPGIKAMSRVDWNIPDPKAKDEMEFAVVRDMIRAKVKSLIQSSHG